MSISNLPSIEKIQGANFAEIAAKPAWRASSQLMPLPSRLEYQSASVEREPQAFDV